MSALSFQDFTAEVLAWTNWWNTAHRPKALSGRTPLEAWQADPTPVTAIPAANLWAFTLEDDGRPRKLTSHGVSWRGRTYTAEWMTGQAGRQVRVRYMPPHDHGIEVYHAATGRYLGPADLADQATGEQISAEERRHLGLALPQLTLAGPGPTSPPNRPGARWEA